MKVDPAIALSAFKAEALTARTNAALIGGEARLALSQLYALRGVDAAGRVPLDGSNEGLLLMAGEMHGLITEQTAQVGVITGGGRDPVLNDLAERTRQIRVALHGVVEVGARELAQRHVANDPTPITNLAATAANVPAAREAFTQALAAARDIESGADAAYRDAHSRYLASARLTQAPSALELEPYESRIPR
jgi:hypothetical protein